MTMATIDNVTDRGVIDDHGIDRITESEIKEFIAFDDFVTLDSYLDGAVRLAFRYHQGSAGMAVIGSIDALAARDGGTVKCLEVNPDVACRRRRQ